MNLFTARSSRSRPMPMIDVYGATGTFSDKHALAKDLAAAVMRWEKVPDLPLFRNNTAAFIHELPADSLSNVVGDSNYVRVQVLTPIGVLDREKQLGVVKELTDIVAAAAGDPGLKERTWVLLTESPEGGWGINGHANTGAPNVVGLVYIAAFALDQGESIGKLLSQGPPTPAIAHLIIDKQGFAWLPEDDFVNHFAADVDPVKARVMFAVQQALSATALQEVVGVPAWKSVPSWYLVAADDQAIPPHAERLFAKRMGATTVEVPSSHVAMVSHPDDVATLIETAARSQAFAPEPALAKR